MLALGLPVVIDAVNNITPAQDGWRSVAHDLGVPLKIVEVICSDAALHRRRLESRVRDLGAFREPTWADVAARRSENQPWPEDHVVLDSAADHDANLALALRYLTS
jgi:predicted kinase